MSRDAAPVPLTPAGLRGGAAGALGDAYDCAASRQVIVRFRAELAATGRLKRGDQLPHGARSCSPGQAGRANSERKADRVRRGRRVRKGDALRGTRMHGRLMRAPIVLVAIVGVAATLLSPAGARVEASRIVDRTFLCESGFLGGLYQVRRELALLGATGLVRADGLLERHEKHLRVSARRAELRRDSRSIASAACRRRQPLKLSTTGMRGGRSSAPGGDVDMRDAAPRATPRARGVRAPRDAAHVEALRLSAVDRRGLRREAALAIGTRAGKPIAYLSVTGTEHARLFTVRTCEED